MPDVHAGITVARDENSRAPEAPLDAEQARHNAVIRAQSQRSRETPSDDSFNKESIVAAMFDDSRTISAGLRQQGEQAARELEAELDERYGEGSEPRRRLDQEQADAEFGRAARRFADVVGPALEILGESYDDEERAGALVQLNQSERELAIAQGVLDPDELDELIALGAQVLDQRQIISQRMQGVLADNDSAQDRNERWQSIQSDYGLSEDEGRALLAVTLERVKDAGHILGALPPDAWEASIRHTYGALAAEDIAAEKSRLKTAILNADSSSISEGLTEAGRPVIERVFAVEQPDYRLAEMLASGRNKPLSDDEMRLGIMTATDDSDVASNVREGGEQIPAATRSKMAALFGS
jgi:hypothetical protein